MQTDGIAGNIAGNLSRSRGLMGAYPTQVVAPESERIHDLGLIPLSTSGDTEDLPVGSCDKSH